MTSGKESSKTNQQPSYLYNVLYIGISFMVLFSANSITQNMISHMYKQMGFTNLGRISVLITYASFGIGSIFASHFKRKIPAKVGLFKAVFAYLSFILVSTLTTYCHKSTPQLDGLICNEFSIYTLNLIFSVVLGFGSSILWLCQSNYVNDCTNESNKGTYHGIFLSLMQFSMFIGSIIAAFVLRHADELTFFLILTCLVALASVMLRFLPAIDVKEEQLKPHEAQETIIDSARRFFDCYKKPAHYPVILSSFMSGLIIAFYATYFPSVIRETVLGEPTNVINQMISFSFIGLGLGQTISGYCVGRIIDRFPNFKISEAIFGNAELALLLSFFAMETQSYKLALLAGLLWGSCDNGAKTMSISLISSKFNGKLELFAGYRATQSFGIVFGSLCTILFSDAVGSVYVLGMLAFLICCHVMFNLTYANMNQKEGSSKGLEMELLERGYSLHKPLIK